MTTVSASFTGTSAASATAALPIDVTCASHPFSTDDVVLFSAFDEMTALNGALYNVESLDANSLGLRGLGANPLPIDGTVSPYGTAETTGGFASLGLSAILSVPVEGEEVVVTLTGGATATLALEREAGKGSDVWVELRRWSGNTVYQFKTQQRDNRYRLRLLSWTSGTITATLADTDAKVPVSDIITTTQSGAAIAGTLDVTGTITGDITGDLSAGKITGTDSSLGITGQAAAQGGAVVTKGGASSTAGNAGGASSLVGGTAGTTGAGGVAAVAGSAGGATSGKGGVASMIGGAGTAGNGAGGPVILTPGLNHGSGIAGAIILRGEGADPTVPLLRGQAIPVSDTGVQSLTVAELLNGIHVNDPGTAVAITLPAGDDIVLGLPSDLAVGDSFDFTLINTGITTEIQTLTDAGGSGTVSFVGSVASDPAVAAEGSGVATWRFRFTGSGNFTAYRIA